MGAKIAFFPIGEVTSGDMAPGRHAVLVNPNNNGKTTIIDVRRLPKGIGTRSEWRLSLKALTRAGVIYPEDGVNFSLIMTIADLRGFAPIYEEVRAKIIRRGLRLADITVAPRVRGRRARSESLEMKGTDHG